MARNTIIMASWIGAFTDAYASSDPDVNLTINGTPAWDISKYLASMSMVYTWAPDKVYKNGSMAAWAKNHGVNTARYPAGENSYWNWENPTGIMDKSSLDPKWDGKKAPEEDWMSMDEYLDLCEKANLRPLVGVNYNCKGHDWVPQNESIARAVRQVQAVVARGFKGAFYYLGNEDGVHPDKVAPHALAMKQVDPTMKVFWNDNEQSPKRLAKFLEVAGDAVDGAEFHGKWPHGGGMPHAGQINFSRWLTEVPLMDHRVRETWRDKIRVLRRAAAKLNRSDLMFANNEYGLGKPKFFGGGWTRFRKSIVAVEFNMEMFVGGYDMAAFWDNGDGGDPNNTDRMLLDTQSNYRMNPMHLGFEMLNEAAGTKMLTLKSSNKRVHGFASQELTGTGGSISRCYVINKMETAQKVQITLPPSVEPFTVAASMVDTQDHWGTVDTTAVACEKGSAGDDNQKCTVTLPPVSFTLLKSSGSKPELIHV